MQVLIIEDEVQAAKRLESLIGEIIPEARVAARIDTVSRAVEFLSSKPAPDLILMDIHLADGISFDIFQQCDVKSPVIFTTAYDEYALRAFKVNSIDYILKPIDKDELAAAIDKFRERHLKPHARDRVLANIDEVVKLLSKKYKSRFVVKVGEHLRTIEVNAILYFLSQDKTTFCITTDNRKHVLDHTLEELDELLDPAAFFRINRKYTVSAAAIQDIVNYTNSRLRLVLRNCKDDEVIVAREKVQEFKGWLDR